MVAPLQIRDETQKHTQCMVGQDYACGPPSNLFRGCCIRLLVCCGTCTGLSSIMPNPQLSTKAHPHCHFVCPTDPTSFSPSAAVSRPPFSPALSFTLPPFPSLAWPMLLCPLCPPFPCLSFRFSLWEPSLFAQLAPHTTNSSIHAWNSLISPLGAQRRSKIS